MSFPKCAHPSIDSLGEIFTRSKCSVCLADKRLFNGKGDVEFDFKGPSGPTTYRQRMNQRDTLKSIRAKMVSPLLS